MRLVPMKEVLSLAEKKGIAYGAYVITAYDIANAAIQAGNKVGVPIILIAAPECCELMGGFQGTVALVKAAARQAKIPVVLHLDHCKTYEECVDAIQAGFTSVMIDGSSLPLEKNIEITKKVVEYAHTLGVTVEGELGKLVGEEGKLAIKGSEAAQTDPTEAAYFVKETQVDCLAVSIGTQHGTYTFTPKLNIERLREIHNLVKVPLVLHGGSGTPPEQVAEAIQNGIRKINVGTDLFTCLINSYINQYKESDFKYNLTPFIRCQQALQSEIEEKIKQFLLIKNS